MKRVQAVIRPEKLEAVQHRLAESGFIGLMVHDVRSHGGEPQPGGEYRGVPFAMTVKHKLLIDLLVDDEEVASVISIIRHSVRTGSSGDGAIFVNDVAAYPINED